MGNKQYCVYILTNSRHTVLYTGVTNNLERRLSEHKSKLGSAFTKKYNVDQLVYYECGDDINSAITREKQIKAGSRQDKVNLINSINPDWKDLSKEFWT
jgi:putative endonuclease